MAAPRPGFYPQRASRQHYGVRRTEYLPRIASPPLSYRPNPCFYYYGLNLVPFAARG